MTKSYVQISYIHIAILCYFQIKSLSKQRQYSHYDRLRYDAFKRYSKSGISGMDCYDGFKDSINALRQSGVDVSNFVIPNRSDNFISSLYKDFCKDILFTVSLAFCKHCCIPFDYSINKNKKTLPRTITKCPNCSQSIKKSK